jgi:ABC-type transporter Mla subunit MlaD
VSATVQVSDTPEPDLIDRIANDLPAEVRTDYYREMRPCRTLQSSDEMLRILRAMQFLHVLMVQVPRDITTEREEFQQLLTGALGTLQTTIESSAVYQRQLDQRLEQLPENIANGISPEVIAAAINESLRQQFVQSTIPETASRLAAVAMQLNDVTTEFGRTATALGNRYRGAAEEARRAIDNIERTSSDAIATTRHGAQELLRIFHQEYRWSICALTSLALVIGIGLGLLFQRWLDRTTQLVGPDPVTQTEPAVKPRVKH